MIRVNDMSNNNKKRPAVPAVIIAIIILAAGSFGLIDSDTVSGGLDSLFSGGTVKSSGVGTSRDVVDISDIPEYSGEAYIAVNDNIPYFDEEYLTTEYFEYYSDLDSLGRCGEAFVNICQDTMPTEPRGSISSIKPSGWHTYKYDFVDGKYLYNRCHLIGYQLAGDNYKTNLITGTRQFNVDGMLPFENMVADYVKETDNHVAYRVTPMYDGDNLVADGVLMEAESVEDDGDGVMFCIFAYNVQDGVVIDYATGETRLA